MCRKAHWRVTQSIGAEKLDASEMRRKKDDGKRPTGTRKSVQRKPWRPRGVPQEGSTGIGTSRNPRPSEGESAKRTPEALKGQESSRGTVKNRIPENRSGGKRGVGSLRKARKERGVAMLGKRYPRTTSGRKKIAQGRDFFWGDAEEGGGKPRPRPSASGKGGKKARGERGRGTAVGRGMGELPKNNLTRAFTDLAGKGTTVRKGISGSKRS